MESPMVAETFRSGVDLFYRSRFHEAEAVVEGLVEQVFRNATIKRFGHAEESNTAFSIIVLSHRTTEKFLAGIRSLALAQHNLPGCEFIFVSNAHQGIEDVLAAHLSDFTLVEIGFNFGASGGRNIGALVAKSDIIVFIDDDGLTTSSAIRKLVEALDDPRIIAARGQAMTFPGQKTPAHYKPSNVSIPRYIDLEGISSWRRDVFNRAGGFNILLFGHEGIALTWLLVPEYGYNAFRYEPLALLQHDYAADEAGFYEKETRYRQMSRYLSYIGLNIDAFARSFDSIMNDLFATNIFVSSIKKAERVESGLSACFLTTVKNQAHFIESYQEFLTNQTDQDFSVLIIDDHSSDDSLATMEEAWSGNDRVRILPNQGFGRSAALNTGLQACDCDIVLMADIDSISMPERLAGARRVFNLDPALDFAGFLIFTNEDYVKIEGPALTSVSSMNVRRLFGMPAPFAALAVRRDRIMEDFDPNLAAGADHDWLSKHLSRGAKGTLFFEPMTYCHAHPEQMPNGNGNERQQIRENLIYCSFEEVLGDSLSEAEQRAALRLAERLPCQTEAGLQDMQTLAARVVRQNGAEGRLPQDQLESALRFSLLQTQAALLRAQRASFWERENMGKMEEHGGDTLSRRTIRTVKKLVAFGR